MKKLYYTEDKIKAVYFAFLIIFILANAIAAPKLYPIVKKAHSYDLSSCRCYNCNGKYEVQLGEYCEHCGKKDYGVYQYAYCSECKKVYTENHPSFCKKDGSKIINKQLVKISEVNTSETELKNGICAIRVDIFTIDAFFLIGILLSGVGVFDKNNHPEKKTVRKEVRYE